MSRAASKAVPRGVRFASGPAAVGTPKGLTLSSRGQGHAFVPAAHGSCPYPILPTLKGSNGSAPRELSIGAVREPPLLLHDPRIMLSVHRLLGQLFSNASFSRTDLPVLLN
jgi:hypothetical protein